MQCPSATLLSRMAEKGAGFGRVFLLSSGWGVKVVKTAILGAGIIGATLAVGRCQRGDDVVLIDAADPVSQSSLGSLAWLNASSTGDAEYRALRVQSLRRWWDLKRKHPEMPAEFAGSFLWGGDDQMMKAHAVVLRDAGIAARVMGGDEFSTLCPAAKPPHGVILHVADEGAANPQQISAWMLERALALGATQVIGTVGAISSARDQLEIQLTDGRVVGADRVICALGNGNQALLAGLGYQQSARRSPGILVKTKPTNPIGRGVFATPKIDFWQGDDGVIWASGALAKTTKDAGDISAGQMMDALNEIVPRLRAVVDEVILRDRPIPDDGFPLMGEVPNCPGVSAVTSHSGMTLAPVIAAAMSQLLETGKLPKYAARYDFAREPISPAEAGAF